MAGPLMAGPHMAGLLMAGPKMDDGWQMAGCRLVAGLLIGLAFWPPRRRRCHCVGCVVRLLLSAGSSGSGGLPCPRRTLYCVLSRAAAWIGMSPVPRNTVKQVLLVNRDRLVQIKCNLTCLRRGSSFLISPGEEEEGEGKYFLPRSVTGSYKGQSPAQRH